MTTNTDLHGAMPELPPLPLGDRFADLEKFRLLGKGGGQLLVECFDEAVFAYARAYARAAIQQAAVPGGLPQAVLTLNAAWNRKEPEEAIAGHMDLCRRLALAAVPPTQHPTGVRCHNDACCGGQLPCPTPQFCNIKI